MIALRSAPTQISTSLNSRVFSMILTIKSVLKITRRATRHSHYSTIRGTVSKKCTSLPCAMMRKKSSFQSNRESSTSVGSKTAMSTQFLTAHARSSTSSINRRRRLTEDTSNLIRSFPPSTKKELVCSKADTYSCMGVPHPKAEQTTTSCRNMTCGFFLKTMILVKKQVLTLKNWKQ